MVTDGPGHLLPIVGVVLRHLWNPEGHPCREGGGDERNAEKEEEEERDYQKYWL